MIVASKRIRLIIPHAPAGTAEQRLEQAQHASDGVNFEEVKDLLETHLKQHKGLEAIRVEITDAN